MFKKLVFALVVFVLTSSVLACPPGWEVCWDGSEAPKGECPDRPHQPEPEPEPGETPSTTPVQSTYHRPVDDIYNCITEDGVEHIFNTEGMPPGSGKFESNGVEYRVTEARACVRNSSVQAEPQPVSYGDCREKILVQRVNMQTVQDWDQSDIIAITNPSSDEREFTNITDSWDESYDAHASLSWNSCWFALQRLVDGEEGWTLWWSAFGSEPQPIRHNGEIVHGEHPDVGPRDQIVYRDRESGHLMIVYRYGNYQLDLGVRGFEPEFNHDGSKIMFRGESGSTATIDPTGENFRLVTFGASLPHSDPNEERFFFQSHRNVGDLASWTPEEIINPILRNATDLAIKPSSDDGFFINQNELFFAVSWFAVVGEQVSDPFNRNHETRAIWCHPDWRN